MRRAGRVDANQDEIVSALRKIGVSVQSLAAIGKGVPDLLCCFRGRLCLLELKDPSKPPSKRRLTPDQIEWHRAWHGAPVFVVETIDEAIAAIGGPAAALGQLHG